MIYQNKTYSERALANLEPSVHFWCQRYYIKGYELEDLEQEVRLHLWRKLRNFDPNNGVLIYTWGNWVIKNRLKDLLKHENRKKRRHDDSFYELNQNICKDEIDYERMYDLMEEKGLKFEDFF